MKGRLEEITKKYSKANTIENLYGVEVIGVDKKDLGWLIERVGELEQEKDEWKDTAQSYYITNQELNEQKKRYKQALIAIANGDDYVAKFEDIARWALEGKDIF